MVSDIPSAGKYHPVALGSSSMIRIVDTFVILAELKRLSHADKPSHLRHINAQETSQ